MTLRIRRVIRQVINALGYDLYRTDSNAFGTNPYRDISKLVKRKRPIILDVGANQGNTVLEFRKKLPGCVIHAFEPSPEVYRKLKTSTDGLSDVYLNNVALGSEIGERTLQISSLSGMTSLLNPGKDYWGEVVNVVSVPVTTLDRYRIDNRIEYVDVIKLDTQGFDFEVLRGSSIALTESRIHLVLIEIIFNEIYEGAASPEEILSFMRSHGFRLVAFYGCHLINEYASWTDALFVNNLYMWRLSGAS